MKYLHYSKNILLTGKWCQWRSKVQQYQGHRNVWMVNIKTDISRLKKYIKVCSKKVTNTNFKLTGKIYF